MAKKSKKTKKYDKTFRRTLKAITPNGNVPKKNRPKKRLRGPKLRAYALASLAAALLVGPATVFMRAHVDHAGGHRDKSVVEQIQCMWDSGFTDANGDSILGWGHSFEPACPIRQSDYDNR